MTKTKQASIQKSQSPIILKVREAYANDPAYHSFIEECRVVVRNKSNTVRLMERCSYALMAIDGLSLASISTKMQCSKDTIKMWLERGLEYGMGGLEDNHRAGRPNNVNDVMVRLLSHLLILQPNTLFKYGFCHPLAGELEGVHKWNANLVCRLLGISQAAFYSYVKQMEIELSSDKSSGLLSYYRTKDEFVFPKMLLLDLANTIGEKAGYQVHFLSSIPFYLKEDSTRKVRNYQPVKDADAEVHSLWAFLHLPKHHFEFKTSGDPDAEDVADMCVRFFAHPERKQFDSHLLILDDWSVPLPFVETIEQENTNVKCVYPPLNYDNFNLSTLSLCVVGNCAINGKTFSSTEIVHRKVSEVMRSPQGKKLRRLNWKCKLSLQVHQWINIHKHVLRLNKLLEENWQSLKISETFELDQKFNPDLRSEFKNLLKFESLLDMEAIQGELDMPLVQVRRHPANAKEIFEAIRNSLNLNPRHVPNYLSEEVLHAYTDIEAGKIMLEELLKHFRLPNSSSS